VERLGLKALYHVIRAWENTVRGEVLDAFLAELVPADRYLEVCKLKTGSLFKLSLVLGALSARAPGETVDKLAEAGELLGIIYQLADDIVDYTRQGKGKAREPGLALFEKWARTLPGGREDPLSAALDTLAHYTRRAEALLESIDYARPDKGRLLARIPRFLATKMLEEAGLQDKLAQGNS